METFSASLAPCADNSPVTSEFSSQREIHTLPVVVAEEEVRDNNGGDNETIPTWSKMVSLPPQPHILDLSAASTSKSPTRQPEPLRAWLLKQLDSGAFPGVVWIDRDKGMFRLPWLHRSKRNWRSEGALIFKAWSQHTGVYKSKDSEATLKTRLRCALTKSRNIEYVKHLTSSDDDDSFRVYRFKSDEEMRAPKTRFLPPTASDVYVQEANAPDESEPLVIAESAMQVSETPQVYSYLPLAAQAETVAANVIYTQPPMYTITEPADDGSMVVVPHLEMVVPAQTTGTLQPESLNPVQVSQDFVPTQATDTLQPGSLNPVRVSQEDTKLVQHNYFTVELLYCGRIVASRPCREGKICRLLDKDDEMEKDRNVLRMPKWEHNKYTRVSAEKVDRFFNHITGGMELELESGNLYATRKCLVRVFYSSILRYLHSLPLKRGERKMIFSTNEFNELLKGLNEKYMSELNCDVCLGFGKPWNFCDGDESMPFVAVKVKCSEAEEKKNMKLMQDYEEQLSSLTISGQYP